MQKFFRRIRRKLIEEGNLSKYLFYAIGEIILVVAGVLIAIQLNNANELRKNENNGAEILKRLKQEPEQDIIYFDSLTRVYDRWHTRANHVLDNVLSGQLTALESTGQYNLGRGTINFLHINKSSFNELLNAGNKIEIQNKDLKNDITQHFQYADIELNKLNLDNERFNKWIYETVDVSTLTRLISNRHLEYEDWSWLKDPTSPKFRLVESRFTFFQIVIRSNKATMANLKKMCQDLIVKIDEELGN